MFELKKNVIYNLIFYISQSNTYPICHSGRMNLKGGDSVRKLRISLFSITFGRTCSSLTVRQYRKGVTEIEVQIIKYSLSFKIVHHLYFLIVSYDYYYFVLSIDIDRLHPHKLFIHCFGTDNIYPFDPRFVHTN